MSNTKDKIIYQIRAMQNPDKARWLENYVKHDIKSYGVGIPEIRKIVKDAENEFQISRHDLREQDIFLNDLMKHPYTEPKLASILYIQLFWNSSNAHETLQLASNWFDRKWIFDWNVCDWLCVRILSPLVDAGVLEVLEEFYTWNKDPNLWKARASLVPFAQSKSLAEHKDTISVFSETLIRRDERFCKTAVGWVLREYSKIDPGYVKDFLETHKEWTTKEVVRNATKYL